MMLTDEHIQEALERAARLTNTVSPDLRSAAFTELLRCLLHTDAGASIPSRVTAPAATTGVTINELLAQAGASTHVERVVAIAYHALQNNQDGVTTKDVADAYGKARTKKPQNIPEVVGICVQRGYLVEGDGKDSLKSWVVTPTGERFIEELLER